MNTIYYNTQENGKRVFNRVDTQGNHFVDGKCVNPKDDSNKEIGSTVNTKLAVEGSYKEVPTNVAENIWLAEQELKQN